jgi:predicted peptidase
MSYRLHVPPSAQGAKSDSRQHPLVIWFHGGGESGTDNREQLAWLELILGTGTKQRSPAALVLALQFAEVETSGAARQAAWNRLDAAWNDVMHHYAIDPDRVYLAGISQGANRAWQYACRHRRRIAALLAMATVVADELPECDLSGLPIWAFTSTHDGPMPIARLQTIAAGARVSGMVTVVRTPSHDCWTAALGQHRAWRWLLDQRRGRRVRRFSQSTVGRYLTRSQASVAGAALLLLGGVGAKRLMRGRRQGRRCFSTRACDETG